MKQKPSSTRKHSRFKVILRLPDLEHAKAAVLNSHNSVDAKRGYRYAIDEFVDGYCSEVDDTVRNRLSCFASCYLAIKSPSPELTTL